MDENTSENLAAKRLEIGRAKVLQYIVRYAREIYPGWDKGAVYFRLVSEQYCIWACFTDCYCKFSKTKLEHIVAPGRRRGTHSPSPTFGFPHAEIDARKVLSLNGPCLAQAEV